MLLLDSSKFLADATLANHVGKKVKSDARALSQSLNTGSLGAAEGVKQFDVVLENLATVANSHRHILNVMEKLILEGIVEWSVQDETEMYGLFQRWNDNCKSLRPLLDSEFARKHVDPAKLEQFRRDDQFVMDWLAAQDAYARGDVVVEGEFKESQQPQSWFAEQFERRTKH